MDLVSIFEQKQKQKHPQSLEPFKCAWQKNFAENAILKRKNHSDSVKNCHKLGNGQGALFLDDSQSSQWPYVATICFLHRIGNRGSSLNIRANSHTGLLDIDIYSSVTTPEKSLKYTDQDANQAAYAFTAWLADASSKATTESQVKLKAFVADLQTALDAQPRVAQQTPAPAPAVA